MRCANCGTVNPDDVPNCLSCGGPLANAAAHAPDVEIEVYNFDAEPPAPLPSAFQQTLAATRASMAEKRARGAADLSNDEFIRGELEDGYEIRRRRKSYRSHPARNILIVVGAAVVVAVGVLAGVRLTMDRLPKYNYPQPASAAATDLALGVAAEMENKKVVWGTADAPGLGTLSVVGDAGKIFVDGNYCADAPAEDLKIPLGRRHVVVIRGNGITLDEVIDLKAGERYRLEPASATELSAPMGAPAGKR